MPRIKPEKVHYTVRTSGSVWTDELNTTISILDSGEDLWERGWNKDDDGVFIECDDRKGIACEVVEVSTGYCVGVLFVIDGCWLDWKGTGLEYLQWRENDNAEDLPLQLVFDSTMKTHRHSSDTRVINGGLVWTTESHSDYGDEVHSTSAISGTYVAVEFEVGDSEPCSENLEDELDYYDHERDYVRGPFLMILEEHQRSFIKFVKAAC